MAIWRWFQKTADRINALEFSDDTKKVLENLSEVVPKYLTNDLLKLCKGLVKEYGKDYADEKTKEILLVIKKTIKF